MPTWASILVAIISALIGPTCLAIVQYHLKKNEKREAAMHAERQQERRREIREIVDESVQPIQEGVDEVNQKITQVSEGTLSTLRNDITVCYYRCQKKHYRNDYDYENLHHMYDAYKALNGNSYIQDVVTRFDALPTKEEYKRVHPDTHQAEGE